MIVVTLRHLQRAMQTQQRIDASHLVLPGKYFSGTPRSSSVLMFPGRIPPFTQPAYQVENHGINPPGGTILSHRAFELLSLAARAATFREDGPVKNFRGVALGEAKLALDIHPDLMPIVKVSDLRRVMAWASQKLSDPRSEVAGGTDMRAGGFLQLVGCRITGDEPATKAAPLDISCLNLPVALSFIGCIFDGPIIANTSEFGSLDISGSSVYGIEANNICTKGDLYMRRATIISMASLSSARIGGVFDASDALIVPLARLHESQTQNDDHGVLNLSQASVDNEVHLNRARIWGGLSLRGMHCRRTVHMQGILVLSPMAVLAKIAFGGLNVSGAIFDYGKLTPSTKCSDNDDREILKATKSIKDASLAMVAAFHISRRLHNQCYTENPEKLDRQEVSEVSRHLINIETVVGCENSFDGDMLKMLLGATLRARITAIRADAIVVDGAIFAYHSIISGRARFKFSHISGNIELAGSVIQSGEFVRGQLNTFVSTEARDFVKNVIARPMGKEDQDKFDSMDKVLDEIQKLRRQTGAKFAEVPDYFPDNFALDFRSSTVGGNLSFKYGEITDWSYIDKSRSASATGQSNGDPDGRDRASISGVISIDDASINGSVILNGANFSWTPLSGVDLDVRKYRNRLLMMREKDALKNRLSTYAMAPQQISTIDAECECECESVRACRLGEERRLKSIDEKRKIIHSSLSDVSVSCRRARVGRDMDLRSSYGIWGLSLENSHIGGSLYFSSRSDGKDVGKSRIINCKNRAENFHGRIDMTSARIDGDAYLVFDPDLGPDIVAEFSEIGGRLDIYPAKSSTRYMSKAAAKGSLYWTECRHERQRRAAGDDEFLKNNCIDERSCSECNAVLRQRLIKISGDSEKIALAEWFISLRNASASYFSHPAQAWPHPGALSLDGFFYKRSSPLGPLAPAITDALLDEAERLKSIERVVGAYGFTIAERVNNWVRDWVVDDWRSIVNKPVIRSLIWLVLVFCLLFKAMSAISEWLSSYYFSIGIEFDNYLLCIIVFLLSLMTIRQISTGWPPAASVTAPMAIEYLRRQRIEPNRYQHVSRGYSPLDPYIVAAQALRESGRYLSANRVEEERIKRRVRMLSWRHHGPVKAALCVLECVSGYGFNISRLVNLYVLLVVLCAATATTGAAWGWFVPREDAVLSSADRGGAEKCSAPTFDACPGLWYALDLANPGLDLGLDVWVAAKASPRGDNSAERCMLWIYSLFPKIVKLIGLLIFALLGAALAARVESAFSRIRE